MKSSSHRHPGKLLFLFGLLALLLGGWTQRQFIYDEVKLHNYTPPTAIAQLATDAAMTDSARRVFYVNQPSQKSRSNFSGFCPTGTEQSVVLGCYKGPQRGIFLLKVDNNELQGIEQVTAAHEMLHAEYDRLSSKERNRVDALLQDYYDNKLTDETTKKTIDGYRKTEPNDVVNEMHSILGTQVGGLPTELEQYYSRYFVNRAKVVKLYTAYEAAFSSRKQQIADYDQQLNDQKQAIDVLEKTVDSQSTALQAQRARLDRLRNSDVAAYNASVDDYNRAADAYNANIRKLRGEIDAYNQLVENRNAIAFEEQSLVDSITAPKVTQP